MKDTADGGHETEILAGLAAGGVASRAAAQEVTMIVPFQTPRGPDDLADLKRRLKATLWNDAVVSDCGPTGWLSAKTNQLLERPL